MATTLYKRKGDCDAPIVVTAENPTFPNDDSDGDTIFENTHFTTEAECWDAIHANAVAWVANQSWRVQDARKELAKQEQQIVEAGLHLAKVLQNLKKVGRI